MLSKNSCAEPVNDVIKHQKHFHRRMRRKCINLCNAQHAKGEEVDPLLQQVEAKGISMSAIRRLEELEKQSKPAANSNRNFGALQEIHTSGGEVSYSQSQGISVRNPENAGLSFPIYTESQPTQESVDLPWKRFELNSNQQKENDRVYLWNEIMNRDSNEME